MVVCAWIRLYCLSFYRIIRHHEISFAIHRDAYHQFRTDLRNIIGRNDIWRKGKNDATILSRRRHYIINRIGQWLFQKSSKKKINGRWKIIIIDKSKQILNNILYL